MKIPNRRKPALHAVIAETVEHGTQLYTDEHNGYMDISPDYVHSVVNHLENYVSGRVHTNGPENFRSLLKRGLNGTYVAVEPFHLFRYVDVYLCFLFYAYFALTYVDMNVPDAEKVDFIVERKGHITKYIEGFHSNLPKALEALDKPLLSRLVGELIPGDKARVPLQTADVLCWHTARYRQPETMDTADLRRYAKIASRKGAHFEVPREDISKLEVAMAPWGV